MYPIPNNNDREWSEGEDEMFSDDYSPEVRDDHGVLTLALLRQQSQCKHPLVIFSLLKRIVSSSELLIDKAGALDFVYQDVYSSHPFVLCGRRIRGGRHKDIHYDQ